MMWAVESRAQEFADQTGLVVCGACRARAGHTGNLLGTFLFLGHIAVSHFTSQFVYHLWQTTVSPNMLVQYMHSTGDTVIVCIVEPSPHHCFLVLRVLFFTTMFCSCMLWARFSLWATCRHAMALSECQWREVMVTVGGDSASPHCWDANPRHDSQFANACSTLS